MADHLKSVLGTLASRRVLQPVGPDNRDLFATVEPVLAEFLGPQAASALIDCFAEGLSAASHGRELLIRMLRPATKRTRRHHLSHPVNSRALARAILAVTACYLALGLVCLAAWRVTGKIAWIDVFFKYPAAILMVILATTELLVSQRVASEFDRRQPLRRAWRLIGLSAGFNLASAVLVQILATWNPAVSAARQLGLLLGGPCRFSAMSAGLLWTLKAYRRSGLLARLRPGDWAVLALMGCYVFLEFRDVVLAWGHGMRPTVWMVLGWPTDPLLWILLAQALRLYRSALGDGFGTGRPMLEFLQHRRLPGHGRRCDHVGNQHGISLLGVARSGVVHLASGGSGVCAGATVSATRHHLGQGPPQ